MKNRFSFLLSILSLLSIYEAQNIPIPVELSLSSPYSVNFNSLANIGSDITFPSFDGVLNGWWVTDGTYSTSNGSSLEGGIYSYGDWGSTKRSLGSMPSNSMKRTSWGAAFTINNPNSLIYGLNISFFGELWSSNSMSPSTVVFDYSVVSKQDYNKIWGNDDETFDRWMSKDDLSFSFTPTKLESNQNPYQSQFLSHVISIDDYKEGKVILIRWSHEKITGKNDHLSINDFSLNLIPLTFTSIDEITDQVPIDTYKKSESKNWVKPLIFSSGAFFVIAIMIIVVKIVKNKKETRMKSREKSPLLNKDDNGEIELEARLPSVLSNPHVNVDANADVDVDVSVNKIPNFFLYSAMKDRLKFNTNSIMIKNDFKQEEKIEDEETCKNKNCPACNSKL